jgi:predicted dehydrogenase
MSRQTRREFLESSMFATAAAVMAGASAMPRRARAAGKFGPNDVLRLAAIGVRGRGGEHLEFFTKGGLNVDVVAIVDVDEAVAQKRAEEVEKTTGKKPACFKDMREVFDNKDIDIVSIATPNHWHSLAAIWAIQAGKDVYVEKPVSHNVSEGRRLVQAAAKYNKVVQTGTQCRSNPGMREAIDYVRSGKIGKVTLARGLCYKTRVAIGPRQKYDAPPSVDYDLWLGPAPQKPLMRPKLHYDWHWVWDTGNGDLGNQGIHQMDLARWGLGVGDLGNGVVSYGGRLGYEDAGETANTQVCIHDFGDKTLVFEVRGLKTEKLQGAGVGVIFYGTEGYVVINSYNGGSAFDPKGTFVRKFDGGDDVSHFANFVSAVRQQDPQQLNAGILEGHLSSALCHLGNISYRLGSPLAAQEVKERLKGNEETAATFERVAAHLTQNSLDLEKTQLQFGAQLTLDGKAEVFTGELASAANAMLTREYRKPFVLPSEGEV